MPMERIGQRMLHEFTMETAGARALAPEAAPESVADKVLDLARQVAKLAAAIDQEAMTVLDRVSFPVPVPSPREDFADRPDWPALFHQLRGELETIQGHLKGISGTLERTAL